ncbi:MAG TPA: SAVED domain-containing protein, partial [Alphaproteobacteria bacterium]|nr:SAVED domain-containing protein [Alphaproteobacteria bacterium]
IIMKFADWFTRYKSPPHIILKTGVNIMLATLTGWAFVVKICGFELSTSDTPSFILYTAFLLGFLFTLFGGAWYALEHYKSQNLKKTVIIEQRGLKFAPDTRLKDAIKNKGGRIEEIDCDIRQRMDNGIINQPEAALQRIISVPVEIETKCNNVRSSDLKIIYGGLMAVPFTFLTGMLLDDENDLLEVFDWDRHAKKWREINGADDNERFNIHGLDDLSGAEESILAVSASYKVDLKSVSSTLGALPIVHMELPNGGADCHWSKQKQDELCRSFSDTIMKLKGVGLRKLHLFIAAPNSLCFNLGRNYDVRNFPDAQIYQYEQSMTPPFLWSVQLPTHGKTAQIIHSTKNLTDK